MNYPTLIIAGVTLPLRSWLEVQQTYEPAAGNTRRRLADGGLFNMTRWRRWKTTLSGSGWIPAPLLGIDYDQPITIHCVQPMAFRVGESLPSGWSARTDYPEVLLPADEFGQQVRLVLPILTVWAEPPRIVPGSETSWELSAEEV